MTEQSQTYILSMYTVLSKIPDGRVALYNTFMGALAVVPASMWGILHEARCKACSKDDLDAEGIGELVGQGFLVPTSLDEQTAVGHVLDKERECNELFLILLPHQDCNFRCHYCYEQFPRIKMAKNVQGGLKRFVRRKVSKLDRLEIGWFGGEPLLALDVIRDLSQSFSESCHDSGCEYGGSMTTNGYGLSPEVFAELCLLNVKKYQITLDGPQRVHDKSRPLADGGRTYDHIIKNMLSMKQTSVDFRVIVRVNFTPHTLQYLPEFLQELSAYFADDDRFEMSFQPVGKWGGAHDQELTTFDSNVPAVCNARLMLEEQSHNLKLGDAGMKKRLRYHNAVCYAARESSLIVGADATLYKCTVALNPAGSIGRLLDTGELEFDSGRYERWTTVGKYNLRKCSKCSIYPICQSRACPLHAMDSGIPPCPPIKKEARDIVRLLVTHKIDSVVGGTTA